MLAVGMDCGGQGVDMEMVVAVNTAQKQLMSYTS